MRTRRHLRIAAFGAVATLVVIVTGPLNTALALANPLLYAATATVSLFIPMVTRLWSETAFSASFCALLAGVIAAPFSALGFLLPIALVVPALCFDAALWRSRGPSVPRLALAAGIAGLAVWAISLPVIDSGLLSAGFILALACIRVASYVAGALLARFTALRLRAGGLIPERSAEIRSSRSAESLATSER